MGADAVGEMAAGAVRPDAGTRLDAGAWPGAGGPPGSGVLPGASVRPGSGLLPDAGILSGEGVLPVLPALRGLLASGGLQRGQVVTTDGWSLLSLALAAGASAGGAWCAAVGLPSLGVRAALDIGLDPDRLLLVAEPGPAWAQVVASLLDGCDIVLLRPPDRPSAQLRRKLEATARRHGCVLLVAGDWDGAATRLRIAAQQWAGLGPGHGRLRARQVHVLSEGRGAGARPRHARIWLPAPDGTVTPDETARAQPARAQPALGKPALDEAALEGATLEGATRTSATPTGAALANVIPGHTTLTNTG
jgi:hypothetical protein